MSYEEFRRRIDTMRQILVGAVPSPAGQIDQITYALMYKFMNDIDDKSAGLPGGKRVYFVGDYEKYNWHRLMESSLGAHERLALYRDAIQTMAKNDNIPELFRSIYQNAFLPFNSATVLNLFLKEADKFDHGESDDIGDAYEYLLSITGAQGDVGQFRTPRHIIKFIVEAVNPTKTDSVLDPAVGTAGFLIAAYNHVKSQHDGKDAEGNSNDEKRLSADELDKIHHNYRGFDIDPTMVRTAKVNMYLHGFKTPDIVNHDSLSSEDYWNDRYDVILANPPFMTPKGGIQPHKKFGISANRAEVLFVDYIASHLKPTGRAGIVVPEGIIFQSGKAYKELRKNLVENSLYAVVSLPAGVFNPYAGVKTSVLLLDKELAKNRDEILFVDINNIGVTLDAKQTKRPGSQLPEALSDILSFKGGGEVDSSISHAVKRSVIAESLDYNLSGSRYISVEDVYNSDYPAVELGDLIEESRERVKDRDIPVWSVSNRHGFVDPDAHFSKKVASEDISNYKVIKQDYFAYNPSRINVGSLALNSHDEVGCVSPMYVVFSVDKEKLLPSYLLRHLESDVFNEFVSNMAQGAVRAQLKYADLIKFKIPLPTIEVQREIVAELGRYQHIIDAAQEIVKTYKPTIKINPEWKIVSLGDLVSVNNGQVLTDFDEPGTEACIKVSDMNLPENSTFITTSSRWTNQKLRGLVEIESAIFPKRGAAIATNKKRLNKIPCYIDNNCMAITPNDRQVLNGYFLYYFMLGFDLTSISNSAGVALINNPDIKSVKIPLPPIEVQREIVAELEAEQELIDANKKLIETMQQKIKSKIAEVWGE